MQLRDIDEKEIIKNINELLDTDNEDNSSAITSNYEAQLKINIEHFRDYLTNMSEHNKIWYALEAYKSVPDYISSSPWVKLTLSEIAKNSLINLSENNDSYKIIKMCSDLGLPGFEKEVNQQHIKARIGNDVNDAPKNTEFNLFGSKATIWSKHYEPNKNSIQPLRLVPQPPTIDLTPQKNDERAAASSAQGVRSTFVNDASLNLSAALQIRLLQQMIDANNANIIILGKMMTNLGTANNVLSPQNTRGMPSPRQNTNGQMGR